ncbi:MAG: hypothetical protein FWE75_18540 [Actinomycetia bacterium]|nr:hypothetical protein [Actinomycetes bacterium]
MVIKGWTRRPTARAAGEQPDGAPASIDDRAWALMAPGTRVEAVVASLVDRRAASASTPIGLSPGEIEAIERDQPAPIGTAYRRFLQLAGGGVGLFLDGSDVFHPLVLGLRQAAADLLAENDVPVVLAPTDRVILMHQGYWFDYLKGTGPDPEVWTYTETFQQPVTPFRSAGRFTDWLRAHADRHRGPGARA